MSEAAIRNVERGKRADDTDAAQRGSDGRRSARPRPWCWVAPRTQRVQSGSMADIGSAAFYWCVKHSRVETGDDVCPGRDRLGPYRTESEAQQALQRVRERNDEWDAEDERWENGG